MSAVPHPATHFDLPAIAKRFPIATYMILAYSFSWSIALPLALAAQGLLKVAPPSWLHYLTAYGPMVAGLVMTRLMYGSVGVRALFKRMLAWRIGLGWLLFAACSPVALYALIAMIAVAGGAASPTLWQFGAVNFLPNLGLGAWLLWILTSGIGEETGWRGFALPHLQQRYSAFVATLILGSVWACWHIPFFFYLPNFRALGFAGFPGFGLGVMSGAIVFTWLYNNTRGSLLAAILWHGAFNFVTASEAGQGTTAMLMSITVMVWAILIVVMFKPATLARAPKQTAAASQPL